MNLSERAQRSIEQIQEDERLRGDLDDPAATALVTWASALAVTIANDPKRSDSEVETAVQAIRTAARTASRSGTNDPQQVVAAAAAITNQYADRLTVPTAVSSQQSVISSAATSESSPDRAMQPDTSALHDSETATPMPADQAGSTAQQGLVHALLKRLNQPESHKL